MVVYTVAAVSQFANLALSKRISTSVASRRSSGLNGPSFRIVTIKMRLKSRASTTFDEAPDVSDFSGAAMFCRRSFDVGLILGFARALMYAANARSGRLLP